jgi:hypothetical protein
MPTHFTNGVSNTAVGDPLYEWGMLDPTKWHTYFNDFHTYVAGDWTITTTEAGAGSATEALADEAFGALLLTNAAGDNDLDFLQKVGESYQFVATKKLFFKARFKVSDATQSDWIMGLQITDTTPLDVTDGIFFQKDDGDTNIDFHVEKNNTATSSAAVGTNADDTYVTLAFAYEPGGKDGKTESQFHVFVDGNRVASVANTNAPDDELLTVSFGIQNGEAVAKTMTIDYILASIER